MRQALEMAKNEHGPDVVILSNRKVMGGIELVAAQDYDETAYKKLTQSSKQIKESKRESETIDVEPIIESSPSITKKDSEVPDFWTEDSTINQMRNEIQSLRTMLEQQMSGLAWGDIGRQPALAIWLQP